MRSCSSEQTLAKLQRAMIKLAMRVVMLMVTLGMESVDFGQDASQGLDIGTSLGRGRSSEPVRDGQ